MERSETAMQSTDLLTSELQEEIIEFAQGLIRIKSLSGQEEEIIRFIEKKMMALGYDEVIIDSMGNILGRIGSGEKVILFDAHVDTNGSFHRSAGRSLTGACMAEVRWI
jgi:acetylornithine deacetylase/succinyl-diaminopimelate desuccinylase-like protein